MSEYLSKSYVNGVYLPSGLLLLGCAVTKVEWMPYAVLLAVAFGGFKIWGSSMFRLSLLVMFQWVLSGQFRDSERSEAYRIPGF
jgi:cytochrome-b5 reductase